MGVKLSCYYPLYNIPDVHNIIIIIKESRLDTSIIKELNIAPLYNCNLADFFRSFAYDLWNVQICWFKILLKSHLVKSIVKKPINIMVPVNLKMIIAGDDKVR
jgi:hypothetical protein